MKYSLRIFCLFISFGMIITALRPAMANTDLNELIQSGNSLVMDEKHEAAIRAYKSAWKLYNSSDAVYNMAVIYDHELEFTAKAVYYYEKFLSLEPEASEAAQIREWLASAKQRLNPQSGKSLEQAKMLPVLNKLMDYGGDVLSREGYEQLAKGEYEAAIGAYRKSLLTNSSATACYNLAILYDYGLNYKANAVYYYQRFLGMAPESANAAKAAAQLERAKQELLIDQGPKAEAKKYRLRDARIK